MKKIVFYLSLVLTLSYFVACDSLDRYDFRLRSAQGELGLANFRGQKVIVYFGFSFCPDVCPATLALLSKELKNFDEKPFLLFISLDPQRDNKLTQTNEWLAYFYPNSTALIAENEEELKKITRNYNVAYEKIKLEDSALEYTIAHSNDIFLFDEKGKLVKIIKDLSQKSLQRDLKAFLEK
ncbi:SCO family protein [Campylobacter sp. MIT 99-7217]|uniref:SCO family protein n=1 Tax=Campylobacter sp. MIT 99-7217 TaxID=535091 RepID=UPI0021AE8305|nr:SCO family protein [Campylobacter sp. MIT 99-7217]